MYLKGMYFQAAQNSRYGLFWYTNSLLFSANSVNLWRLKALEGIAQILEAMDREKRVKRYKTHEFILAASSRREK